MPLLYDHVPVRLPVIPPKTRNASGALTRDVDFIGSVNTFEGKLIEDEELRDAMKEKGLGTPATRAAIIEGLLTEKYMLREGRELIPTAKAFQLMTLLRGLAIEDLTKPELTGNWEYQLAEMEHGRLSRDAFMAEIAKMAERIVRKAKEYDRDTIPGDYATLATPCPNCGGELVKRAHHVRGRGSHGARGQPSVGLATSQHGTHAAWHGLRGHRPGRPSRARRARQAGSGHLQGTEGSMNAPRTIPAGPMGLDDILGLRLNADWVVLSACNTGAARGESSTAHSTTLRIMGSPRTPPRWPPAPPRRKLRDPFRAARST